MISHVYVFLLPFIFYILNFIKMSILSRAILTQSPLRMNKALHEPLPLPLVIPPPSPTSACSLTH